MEQRQFTATACHSSFYPAEAWSQGTGEAFFLVCWSAIPCTNCRLHCCCGSSFVRGNKSVCTCSSATSHHIPSTLPLLHMQFLESLINSICPAKASMSMSMHNLLVALRIQAFGHDSHLLLHQILDGHDVLAPQFWIGARVTMAQYLLDFNKSFLHIRQSNARCCCHCGALHCLSRLDTYKLLKTHLEENMVRVSTTRNGTHLE